MHQVVKVHSHDHDYTDNGHQEKSFLTQFFRGITFGQYIGKIRAQDQPEGVESKNQAELATGKSCSLHDQERPVRCIYHQCPVNESGNQRVN